MKPLQIHRHSANGDTTVPSIDSASSARDTLAPFQDLLADIETIADGDLHHPITTTGPPPVLAIAVAVNRLRANLLNGTPLHHPPTVQADSVRDRAHLASDLYHLTVQRLFSIGLTLQSAAERHPALAEMVQPLIEQTDATIRELRTAIFRPPLPRSASNQP
jgi:methyl-accepting chemotaxis protein